jgi:hypothetical protein
MHEQGKRGSVAEEGADMTGDDVREVFEAILPQEEIDRLCVDCDVSARQRTMNLGRLVRAMVSAAGAPGGAYQADILRSYLECEVPQVARSAFYRWFDEPLERFMAALAYARAQQVDLSGPLGGVNDWYIVDSTTVTVRDGRAMDADVHVGSPKDPLHLRLFGVRRKATVSSSRTCRLGSARGRWPTSTVCAGRSS